MRPDRRSGQDRSRWEADATRPHPCTTFDKWRVLLVVEDDDTIAGLVRTWF